LFKKVSVFLLIVTLMLGGSALAEVANTGKTTIPDPVLEENHPTLELQHRIYVENFDNGVISRVDNAGNHTVIGHVTAPATTTYQASDGFWAAHYSKASDGTHGNVTAIGVNALHIRVGPEEVYDPEVAQSGKDNVWVPQLISILPSEEGSGSGRIGTDIPGGSALFGGWTSVYVGSPVRYYTSAGEWRPIEEFYRTNGYNTAPKRLLIEVYQPSTAQGKVSYITFENKVGGTVRLEYPNGYSKDIATVLQRVEGHGRFAGSEYAEVGRVRANHGGVLDLSTSPKVGKITSIDERGGFQIIPPNHAKYLAHFLNSSYIGRAQWMIVGPLNSTPDLLDDPIYFDGQKLSYDPAWEAVAPIFGMYIKPKQIPNEKELSTYFEISKDNGATWTDPDVLQGTSDTSLIDVTHIRVKLNY
jgi:hypothetical protein